MSEETKPNYAQAGGVPVAPQVLIRGGTMSSRQTNKMRQDEVDANRRRALQDQQQQIAGSQQGAGGVAALRSRKLITQDSPRLVLWYKKHDQYCLSEITMVPGTSGGLEPMFTLVCTRCLERGVPQGQAQLQVRNSNRSFAIDDTKRGPQTIHEGNVPRVVMSCGTVTVNDTVRCGNCGWAVKIVDSRVEEV